jgi:hypothetical protein
MIFLESLVKFKIQQNQALQAIEDNKYRTKTKLYIASVGMGLNIQSILMAMLF